nr:hypothetical protein [Tanacetum cinerariifolium]
VASRGWSFAFAVPGPMTHLVTSLTHDSANSCVMQGASCTQRKVSMVLFVLPSVLLLVVIVFIVVIVVVISVVVVVAIVGVVVVVVGSSVYSINKFLLVIVGSFFCYWNSTCTGVPISIVSIFHVSILCFQSSSNAISNQLPDGSLSHNWCYGFNLTGDEDPSDEDGDTRMGDSTGVLVSLGEKTSMFKRYLVKSFEESGEMLLGKITIVILVRDRCPRGKVPGPMTHLVTSLTPDSANSCVMQGASYTQRKVSRVLFVLPSVLLVVVIVVTVVIVVVISVVVVVVAIVGVVVVIVGSSVSFINKLSLVIIACASRAAAMLSATSCWMAA